MIDRNGQKILPLPFSLKVYSTLSWVLTPLLHISKPLLSRYGGFRDTVPERLGKFSPDFDHLDKIRGNRKLVWLHAVSVGEASVAMALVEAIRKRRPDSLVAVSTTTFTGRDFILRNFKPDLLFFYPLDLPGPMRRLVTRLLPDCFVDIEVELWPNCFRALVEAGVPMALANGRISDRAANPPGFIKGLYRWLLGSMDRLFMRSDKDVERVITLGAPREKTVLAGNLKFAACGVPPGEDARNKTRSFLGIGNDSKLLVCGSTHPGEDEILIKAWIDLLKRSPWKVKIVIAPRHLEQVDRIVGLMTGSGAMVTTWTNLKESQRTNGKFNAVVVDTIGELMGLYAASDVAFVGGSLIKKGGHNVLEPVAMGVPTLHGPSMANFHDLKELLSEAGLIREVSDSDDIVNESLKIMETLDRADFIERSLKLINSQLKASDIIADWVAENLDKGPELDYREKAIAIKNPTDFPPGIFKPVHWLFAQIGHSRVVSHIPAAVKLPVPVISVGNITFGGTAKTPHVELMVRHYRDMGYSPGVVSRGYLGRIDRESRAPEIVSDGSGVLLDWSDAGDEASLMAESLVGTEGKKGIPVAVGRDRVGASKILIEKCGCDLIILDDGFQFTSMARDVDLVLIDAISPFGWFGEKYGFLREPVKSISRADAIVITHAEAVGRHRIEWIMNELSKHLGRVPMVIESSTRIKAVKALSDSSDQGLKKIAGSKVVAFAGIGNHESFRRTLSMTGCELIDLLEFPDHHTYRIRDIEKINGKARSSGAEYVVTTAKDAVRLRGMDNAFNASPLVVEIEIEPWRSDVYQRAIDSGLSVVNKTTSGV